ncbi:MAG: hypothetical protein WB510_11190 [Candidatus Sulfotelmatobacter sp.]
MAMKLTTGILAMAVMTGGLWAQNPTIINNVQSTMNSVQQKKTNDSDAALDAAGVPKKAPAAKPAAASAAPAKPAAAKSPAAHAAKSAASAATTATSAKPAAKPHDPMAPRTAQAKTIHARPVIAAKPATAKPATTKIAAKPAAKSEAKAAAPDAKIADAIQTPEAAKAAKPEDKKWAMNGKRDPFFSPVVQQPTGSGCSTGKKCLEIGQINLRGVVRSDSGFIAVVTNNLNKAYFLRENDPVFNGYVVKITGDSVVFQETVQDKLGKPFTREVVKRLFTPAV